MRDCHRRRSIYKDAGVVGAVLVDTLVLRNVGLQTVKCVEIDVLYLAIDVADCIHEDTLVRAKLSHIKRLACFGEELAPAARRVFHAVQMPKKNVAVFATIFIAFCTFAVYWRLIRSDGALNEGDSDVVLEDAESWNGRKSEESSDSDKGSHWCEVFEVIHVLDLRISLGDKATAIASDVAATFVLVFEGPASP